MRGLRNVRSRVAGEEPFSHHEANFTFVQPAAPTQAAGSIQPALTTKLQDDVVS